MTTQAAPRSIWTGFKRGLGGRCPACGQGRLFRAYLKVDAHCDVCDHHNGQYPADDAPPYFTIFLVGHLVVAPLLAFSFILTWPTEWVLAVLLPLVGIVSLVALPLVKGAVVGILWAVGKPPPA